MDLNLVLTFGIPAAVALNMLWRKLQGKPIHIPGLSRHHVDQPGALVAQHGTLASGDAPLAPRQWISYVNDAPDRVPHVAIIGPSGAGKTTLATVVLNERRGQIVVVTAKEGDGWGGLPYVGIDEDATYTMAGQTLTSLLAEVKGRLVAVKQKRMTDDYLTIVIDDFSTLVKECEVAADVVKLVARLGRSLRVRLVMLSDSALVKAIGLEGEGETRSNFAFIRLARGHKGAIEVEGEQRLIETAGLDQQALRVDLAARAWRMRRSPDDELREIYGLSVEDRGIFGGSDRQTDQTDDRQTADKDRLALALMRNGVTRETLRATFRDLGYGLDNNEYTRLREQIDGGGK